MTATVTGFHGARAGNGPFFSPRFRAAKKSNAGKYYRKKNLNDVNEVDDYLYREDSILESVFEIDDILSFSEFGFVKAYKARLRRKGLDPKQLYCVNRHMDTPRTCLTSLPKLKRNFLVQQNFDKMKDDTPEVTSPIEGHLQFNIRNYNADIPKNVNLCYKGVPIETKLEKRLRQLENNNIPGFIVRSRNHGRPLGNITSLPYLNELLENTQGEDKRRPSIFYRTEI
ncbi:hypothetical protein SNE40_018949 [Patella caerulea]|uniref:Uncharacterized protein n=1 Tax=Patella caerulea TaxID=87958 RepID=A0AAN8J695_PATCE